MISAKYYTIQSGTNGIQYSSTQMQYLGFSYTYGISILAIGQIANDYQQSQMCLAYEYGTNSANALYFSHGYTKFYHNYSSWYRDLSDLTLRAYSSSTSTFVEMTAYVFS